MGSDTNSPIFHDEVSMVTVNDVILLESCPIAIGDVVSAKVKYVLPIIDVFDCRFVGPEVRTTSIRLSRDS